MANITPTIKGIFINSHVNRVRRERGEEGVRELEKRFGRPVKFSSFEDVPVHDEVKLIELTLDILMGDKIPAEKRSFEAGRLHFKNFSETPLGKIIFSQFRNNYKLMMINAPSIAGHVFKGVRFYSEDLGPKEIVVTMENNDYPIEHFQGLFQEWMDFSGLIGTVEFKEAGLNRYEYRMIWQ